MLLYRKGRYSTNFSSKYRLYFDCRSFKVFGTLSCMAATWCVSVRRRTIGLVALAVSSGSVERLTTVVVQVEFVMTAGQKGSHQLSNVSGNYMHMSVVEETCPSFADYR